MRRVNMSFELEMLHSITLGGRENANRFAR